MNNPKESQYYTVPQAARVLGVSSATVWRWIDAGRLQAYRVGPRGIRVKQEDLDAMIKPARAKETKAVKEGKAEGLWAGYDPERVRKALEVSAGALQGVDRESLIADIHEGRQQSSNARSD